MVLAPMKHFIVVSYCLCRIVFAHCYMAECMLKSASKMSKADDLLQAILDGQNRAQEAMEKLSKRIDVIETPRTGDDYEYEEFDTGSCENDNRGESYDNDNMSTHEYSHGKPVKHKSSGIFSSLGKTFKNTESTGPGVDQDLADLANEVFTKGIDGKKLAEIKDKFKRPDNCPMHGY